MELHKPNLDKQLGSSIYRRYVFELLQLIGGAEGEPLQKKKNVEPANFFQKSA